VPRRAASIWGAPRSYPAAAERSPPLMDVSEQAEALAAAASAMGHKVLLDIFGATIVHAQRGRIPGAASAG
jgi:hypothetical protein